MDGLLPSTVAYTPRKKLRLSSLGLNASGDGELTLSSVHGKYVSELGLKSRPPDSRVHSLTFVPRVHLGISFQIAPAIGGERREFSEAAWLG